MHLQRGVFAFIIVLIVCFGFFTPIAWADDTINASGQTIMVPSLTQNPLGLSVTTLITATPSPTPVFPAGTSGSTDGSYSDPSTVSDGTGTGTSEVHPLMHFTKDQLDEMQNQIDRAPKYSAPVGRYSQIESFSTGPKSLLSYLPYTPSQRDQGYCGDCWVWASTGALEIDHNVNNGIFDRLSTQYINSKYNGGTGTGQACCGGTLDSFTAWYNTDKTPIPWSNTNAVFGDFSVNCPSGGSATTAVPISSISTQPHYQMNSISDYTILTHGTGVTNATAISNIESALDSNKAVVYSFYLPTAGWYNGVYPYTGC